MQAKSFSYLRLNFKRLYMTLSSRNRKRGSKFIFLLLFVLLIYIFRVGILQKAGAFLVKTDPVDYAPVLVVLGGNSLERGHAALQLYNAGKVGTIVCTGGNIPGAFVAIDTLVYEAQLTADYLIRRGVQPERVVALNQSTSTLEEAHEVLEWCNANNISELTILSSNFHTRRVRRVFKKAFKGSESVLSFTGAPAQNYDEAEWWKSEEGLIMVNNEYVKNIYYLIYH